VQLSEHSEGDLELSRVDAARIHRTEVGGGIGGGHTEFYPPVMGTLSGVEAQAELAQQACQPLPVGA